MRQALAGVGLEIYQAVAHAVGLVEPDAVLVVHADVPERVHRAAGIEREGQPDALFVARLGQLALEIAALERGTEALLEAAGEFRLHVVRTLKHLGGPCGLSVG
jgi:hypothetical protein